MPACLAVRHPKPISSSSRFLPSFLPSFWRKNQQNSPLALARSLRCSAPNVVMILAATIRRRHPTEAEFNPFVRNSFVALVGSKLEAQLDRSIASTKRNTKLYLNRKEEISTKLKCRT